MVELSKILSVMMPKTVNIGGNSDLVAYPSGQRRKSLLEVVEVVDTA